MIEPINSKRKFYFITSGNWKTYVVAESKQDAINLALSDVVGNNDGYQLGSAIIILEADEAVKDLTLEESLKFISTADAADMLYDDNLRNAIKLILDNG
jgi:hypothetical protein